MAKQKDLTPREQAHLAVVDALAAAEVQHRSPKELIESKKYRPAGRTYSEGEAQEEVLDLGERFKIFPFSYPLIAVQERPQDPPMVVIGVLVYKAAKKAGVQAVPVKILQIADVAKATIFAGLSEADFEQRLSEALQILTFMESRRTTPFDDQQLLGLFCLMHQTFPAEERAFPKVLRILSMTSKSRRYRDTKRLWDLSRIDALVKLVELGEFPIATAKKEEVQRVFLSDSKAERATAEIQAYCAKLKEQADAETAEAAEAVNLGSYNKKLIERIVEDADLEGGDGDIEETEEGAEDGTDGTKPPGANPQPKSPPVRTWSGTTIKDHSTLLLDPGRFDLSAPTPRHVEIVLDAYVILMRVAHLFRTFLSAVRPNAPGGPAQSLEPFTFSNLYDVAFLLRTVFELNLEQFANHARIADFLAKEHALFLVKDDETKGLDAVAKKAIYAKKLLDQRGKIMGLLGLDLENGAAPTSQRRAIGRGAKRSDRKRKTEKLSINQDVKATIQGIDQSCVDAIRGFLS